MIKELDGKLQSLSHKFPSLRLSASSELSFDNCVFLAIAYNMGVRGMVFSKRFKQGHKNKTTGKYYGEEFAEFLRAVDQIGG